MKKDNKTIQFTELSEEELKNVNGGLIANLEVELKEAFGDKYRYSGKEVVLDNVYVCPEGIDIPNCKK